MRLTFGFLLLTATTVSGSAAGYASAHPRPSFNVIYNDDADLAYTVPDRMKSEALLRENIGALADTPVKTLVYCLGMGGDLMVYDTKVASRVGWRKSPDEIPGSLMAKRMENARVCLAQGADAVRTAGETAKRLGLFFIPSLRMNDAHFMADPDNHAMTGEFWFKHREEYTIKDSPLPFQKAYGNLLDYSHAEVRQHRLDTAFEAMARYQDLMDGFELDFNRFQVFFPKGKAAAGAPLITAMVRQVRARLDELAKARGRPFYLFVRVPPSLADCTFAGLDVAQWMREGLVDVVSPAQIMTLAGDMPIDDLVELGRQTGVGIYPSLYPRNSWRLVFPENSTSDRYAGASVNRDSTPEEFRAVVANYDRLGVAGFYLFNFYNAFGSWRPQSDGFYRVLRDLARPANLTGQSKIYAVTKSFYNDGPGSYAYGKQLPAKLSGRPLQLKLLVAEDPARSPFPLKTCELRLGLRALPADAGVTIGLNGHAIYEGRVVGQNAWFTGKITGIASQPRDVAEVYLHVPLDHPDYLLVGENLVTVEVPGVRDPVEITDCEVRFDYYHELEKLWAREPTPLNEAKSVRR
jgi:hypothetical protein